jgi:putative ABC transport system substrate-binding protein
VQSRDFLTPIPSEFDRHQAPRERQATRLLTAGGANLHREGGLIGYGINVFVLFRRAATFVDKILKGAKPADIPFEQATRFETSVSSKTATTLGINIPNTLLVRADEVVE